MTFKEYLMPSYTSEINKKEEGYRINPLKKKKSLIRRNSPLLDIFKKGGQDWD
jgi:hypothetical protein